MKNLHSVSTQGIGFNVAIHILHMASNLYIQNSQKDDPVCKLTTIWMNIKIYRFSYPSYGYGREIIRVTC